MNKKPIKLIINDKEYCCNTIFSIEIFNILSSKIDEQNYEKKVALAILTAIQLENDEGKPSIEEIIDSGYCLFKQYIGSVVEDDEEIKKYYEKRTEIEPICERLCKASEDYKQDLKTKFAEQVSPILKKAYAPLLTRSEQFAEFTRKMTQITTNFNQSISPILKNIAKMQESILSELKKTAQAWNEIDWKALEGSYCEWGKYGWTLIGHAPVSLFANRPQNQADADKQALHFFNKDYLIMLFNDLQKLQANKKDLESAILCFQNRQYKACSMLLCAMIEAPFIKIQPVVEKRAVGLTAIKLFSNSQEADDMRFLYLHTQNVLSFLNMLFESGHNFISEPNRLNRNFIDHGMSKRYVHKKDCVKLFLGLYNTLQMFTIYK